MTRSWQNKFLAAGLVFLLCGCALTPKPSPGPDISYHAATFADLRGWEENDPTPALTLFKESCHRTSAIGEDKDWQSTCQAASALTDLSDQAIRHFFETWFAPVLISGPEGPEGLFTGYYEPVLLGARERSDQFPVPLLSRPEDLIQVDLGQFRPNLKGQKIAGRLEGSKLVPYDDRGAITAGALGEVANPLVYLADPVDAFFLHIQGSGRIKLADGQELRVNYAGQNGHAYTAIGRVLIARGEVAREDMSMQAIRRWLQDHPDQAQALMNQNASYIFFRQVDIADPSLGPLGAQGLPLTPMRSLAVDKAFHRLGTPIWLETNLPATNEQEPEPYFAELMVAQDTGGAIKGAVRGDIYFGSGQDAAALAGRMQAPGRYWLLLPKALAAKRLAASQL